MPAVMLTAEAVVFEGRVNVPPLPFILRVELVYVQLLMALVPDVAVYSTVLPAFKVGVETVSSPDNFSVPELEKVVDVRLYPARFKVPPALIERLVIVALAPSEAVPVLATVTVPEVKEAVFREVMV